VGTTTEAQSIALTIAGKPGNLSFDCHFLQHFPLTP
jgi:hypothetical protein